MGNLMAFIGEFLSYIIVFVIFIATMIIAGNIGVKMRKSKDAKTAATATASETAE